MYAEPPPCHTGKPCTCDQCTCQGEDCGAKLLWDDPAQRNFCPYCDEIPAIERVDSMCEALEQLADDCGDEAGISPTWLRGRIKQIIEGK